MSHGQQTGPSAAAAWERYQVEAEAGETVRLLALPDASNPARAADGVPPLLHVLLQTPALATGAQGWPVISLLVFLRRTPSPGEAWAPLVEGGQVNLDVTLTPSPLARSALARQTGAECLSVFARDGVFRLAAAADPAPAADPALEPAAPDAPRTPAAVPARAPGSRPGGGPAAGGIMSETPVAGAAPRASLSARLDAAQALALERAFATGQAMEGLVVRGEIGFRAAAPGPRTIRLVGSWAAIFDALAARLGGARDVSLDAVRAATDEASRDGALRACELDDGGEHPLAPPLPEDAFALFMAQASAVVLERLTPALPPGDAGNRYRLAADRPMEAFALDAVRRTLAGAAARRHVAETALGELVAQARRAAMPLDAAIGFHVLRADAGPSSAGPASGGGGFSGPTPSGGPPRPTAPAPRLLRTGRGSRSRAPSGHRTVVVEDADGGIRSLGSVLQTGAGTAAGSAHALLRSDLVSARPGPASVKAATLDDVASPFRPRRPIEPFDTPKSLPVVANATADPWPDRLTAGKMWYAPSYAPRMPDPGAAPDASPFLFTFERTGVTPSGAVGIRSMLRFTLDRGLSPTGKASPPPDPGAVVWTPTNGLSVVLHLPFVDEVDGTPKTHPFPAAVQPGRDGSLVCSVELVNQWARLLYGALSVPGFQAQPVRVSVAYSFPAYIPNVRWTPSEWLLLRKEALVPIARSAAERAAFAGRVHLDPADGVIRHGAGEFRLTREAPRPAAPPSRPAPSEALAVAAAGAPGRAPGGAPASAVALRPVGLKPIDLASDKPVKLRPDLASPPVIVRPPIKPVLPDKGSIRADYFERTIAREAAADLLVPCAGFGASYRDRTGGGDVAIGCQDALALGHVQYRSHEEMPALATDRYRVFRSLQQVGRFLVSPARYRVGRADAAAGERAFAPAIAMYSVLDPDDDARSLIAVEATLEPDIPPFARQELLQALRAHSPSPALDYPTEVAQDIAFVWSLPPGLAIEPQALRVPNGFRVTLGTNLMGALLLENLLCRDGVAASVAFRMPDGTTVPSVLEVGLANVAGTWGTGPFALALEGGALRLTNRVERPVDLVEVLAVTATRAVQRVPAETRLAAGASHAAVLPAATAEAFPVYAVPPAPPATLEEVRGVLDRVTANVLFFDLINHANHGLARIELKSRLRGVPGEQTVGLSGEPGSGVATMVLPLTVYLANRVLEFRVTKTFGDGRTEQTPWLAWDLDKDGSVVSLTWERIAASA